MDDGFGSALMAVAALQILSRRRERAAKTPEELKAEDDARASRLAEQRQIQEAKDREERERAPRAFRRRQMKALQLTRDRGQQEQP